MKLPRWCSGVLDPRAGVSNPDEAMDFLKAINPQHTFLQMGSKDGCPISKDFMAC
jgi:hypothetical protein